MGHEKYPLLLLAMLVGAYWLFGWWGVIIPVGIWVIRVLIVAFTSDD